MPTQGRQDGRRPGPENPSEVRAKAKARRNSRELETSPGAWPEGLIWTQKYPQELPPGIFITLILLT